LFFLKFASWKGLPLQLRFGQLEKHLKSSLPALKGVWRRRSKNNFLEICQLEWSPITIALWAAGKAPEKLTACSQGCVEGKIKKFASWKGLPLQLRFGQLEKHLKSSLPSLKGVWRGKSKKNNFSGSEKLFFEICQLEGSPIAIAAGKAPEKLTACSQGCLEGKIKKATFQALRDCFLKFASRTGLPLQLRFGEFAQSVYIVGTGICCCHCVAASFHTDLTKSPRLNSKTYLAPRLSSL